jgi:serine/threonine protein kinase
MAKPRLETGSTLDGYLIGERLHKGGMATLWEVTKPDVPLPMLMKIPILHEGEDPAAIVSFEMEQMIMPRLKGPHVPRFVANGDFATQPYIVMERIAGTTLLKRLDDLPLPVEEVAAIAARVALALDNLHRQNLVHLDVKPSNIIIRPNGDAVMIDFGLSRHRDLPDLMSEEFRLPYGTAPYMAPEQVMGIRHDPRSDLFALGVLMYFFATGVRPFGDPQKLKGLKQRLWRDPVPLRKLRPDIPLWFQEIVMRCLEVNAARRPQTAAQLAFDLQNPSQIELTSRAEKLKQDSYFTVLKRKSEPLSALIDQTTADTSAVAAAPILAVAIDLNEQPPELSQQLRTSVASLLERTPGTRLALLNVLKLARVTIDTSLDSSGHNKHVQRLVLLKDWAHALGPIPCKITYHVIEAVDPADAILDFSRTNNVDHIVMGARANSTMRKLLGSVSGKVAAEAPCTVTVVRARVVDSEPVASHPDEP